MDRNWMKMQNSTLPKFKILFFSNFGFPKNTKSAYQNLEKHKIGTSKSKIENLDYDFDFLSPKFNFENVKIGFSNSSRISFRDPKI